MLLSFQIRVGEATGVLTLCLPWRSIETVAPSLTANSFYSVGARQGAGVDLLAPIEQVTIEVRAEVGGVDLTIDEVLSRRPGAVVRLGTPVDGASRCTPGTCRSTGRCPARTAAG